MYILAYISKGIDTKAFTFNSSANYRAGGNFKERTELSLTDQQIMVDGKGSHFQATLPDVFADYKNPPLTGDVGVANKAWHNWKSTPFDWWQCQLNFAIWCATAGCGVSYEDHLQANNRLLASLYRFHVYIIRPGVFLCSCASPSLEIPRTPSTKLITTIGPSNAFAMSTDWRQKLDHGCQDLGSYSQYMEPSGAYHQAHHSSGPFFTRSMPFALTVWTTLILDKGQGFTQAGVVRLYDSIRTSVWTILGSQARTRSNVLKIGMGFDAQMQFLASLRASFAIRKRSSMHPLLWTTSLGSGSTEHPAIWNSIWETFRATTTKS